MGLQFSKFWNHLFGDDEFRILILGLDAAGKTTILYKLHMGEVQNTTPTIGFNVETIQFNDRTKILSYDLGGQSKVRKLWRHYYDNTDGVVFVIDSCDHDRLAPVEDDKDWEDDESKAFSSEEIKKMMSDDLLRNASLLVMANKQDCKNALLTQKVLAKLNLQANVKQPWYIQGTSAITGDGLHEGMNWLIASIKDTKKKLKK